MDQVITLSNVPNQTTNVSLNVDGNTLQLNLAISFNEMANYWVLAISDSANNLLVDSIPLVTGVYPAANLLAQQQYLAIGSWYLINVAGTAQDYPDATTLGTSFVLLVGDTNATVK